ncbi:MAG: hypothetical protein O3A46_17480 [Candidatus Poribacteria bacterium]|nr:hypothetical protein [Candidatus Poribacteria bacterium]
MADLDAGSSGSKRGSDPKLAKMTVPEVRRLLEGALPCPPRSKELRWQWSQWRRRKRQMAKIAHWNKRRQLRLSY